MSRITKSNRSLRVDDHLWDAVKEKAEKEAPQYTSMTQVIVALLEGYRDGRHSLPKVELVYPQDSNLTS